MSEIRIAVVEDEENQVREICGYLKRFGREKELPVKTSVYRDGEDILDPYRPEHDIILMDIQMRFTDGMTAARRIRELDQEVMIIFLTGMAGYAVQSYEVDAQDYMVKPVPYETFARKLERAVGRLKRAEGSFLVLALKDGAARVAVSSIYYIESMSHQMIYYTKDGEYSVRGRMDDLEAKLLPHGFFRSNRGYLVNLAFVTAVRDDCCIIQGKSLPISRHRRAEFMKELTRQL